MVAWVEKNSNISNDGTNDVDFDVDVMSLWVNVNLKDLRKSIDVDEVVPEGDEFKFLNKSKDENYFVYRHIVPDLVKNYTTSDMLKRKIKRHLGFGTIDGILITDRDGNEYPSDKEFKAWEKIYFKVPSELVCVDNFQDTSVEMMKCKWNSYFWIDVSKHNSEINLDEFIKWNREQRDSPDENKRWVSFAYIRVSDNLQNDPKAENHIDKINKYNQNDLVKNNHEQIACGVYHRLSGSDPIKQADVFIRQLEKYSSKNNCLMPMVDIEDWIDWHWWVTAAMDSKNFDLVRNNTLKWLERVEKQTWIVPWIYCNHFTYKKFFEVDKRFDRYKTWIAAYSSSRNVDEADMRQYSERWKVWWIPGNVDLNQTNDIQWFMA